jgi:hypothetical protein
MNIRKEWTSRDSLLNGYSQFYSKEETISDVQENFDIRRYQSAEGYSVGIINDITPATPTIITEQVLIQDFTNPLNEYREDRKIHFELTSVAQRGSYVYWKNRYWLILTKVESNEAYLSAKITECNNTALIQTGTTKAVTGYDSLGRPIYTEVPIIFTAPCFTTTKFASSVLQNDIINLPKGQMFVSFQYNSAYTITLNHQFNMYGYQYKIIDIDLTKVVNSIGIITILSEVIPS